MFRGARIPNAQMSDLERAESHLELSSGPPGRIMHGTSQRRYPRLARRSAKLRRRDDENLGTGTSGAREYSVPRARGKAREPMDARAPPDRAGILCASRGSRAGPNPRRSRTGTVRDLRAGPATRGSARDRGGTARDRAGWNDEGEYTRANRAGTPVRAGTSDAWEPRGTKTHFVRGVADGDWEGSKGSSALRKHFLPTGGLSEG
jgi:hypothetical protein